MKYEVYETQQVKNDLEITEFYSRGTKGIILKRVSFSETEVPNLYNLAFGSVDENDNVNDMDITDNGDRDTILATVYSVVVDYTKLYPERWVHFKGSTSSRTRLYRMAIGLNFEELSGKFLIYGCYNEIYMPFIKNINASAFLIRRKE